MLSQQLASISQHLQQDSLLSENRPALLNPSGIQMVGTFSNRCRLVGDLPTVVRSSNRFLS